MPARTAVLPIESHALIGNTLCAALVDPTGAMSWACLPRFDSPAVFAALLGATEHGMWRISPAGSLPERIATSRAYLGSTLTLQQEWITDTGTARVIDFMPAPQPDGTAAAQVLRIVVGVAGEVQMRSELVLRPDYGQAVPSILTTAHRGAPRQLVHSRDGDTFWIDGPTPGSVRRGRVTTTVTVQAGERVAFALTHHAAGADTPAIPDADAAFAHTQAYWTAWASQCTYTGSRRQPLLRSLLTLKALCHPDGGVIAAPTTSLPEEVGGERNWDYRFTWLRDSALTVSTLLAHGLVDEARKWRAWLVRTIGGDLQNLQILYGLAGERDVAERTLDWLPGYAGSQPVRIGNAAATQRQLDVYGEVVVALHNAERAGLPPLPEVDRLVAGLVGEVEAHWSLPDEGIWEVRGPRRHFVHSKVMAWACVDRAIKMGESRPSKELGEHLDRWRQLRDRIHADVCTHGYDPDRNTFTQYYDSSELDAALLLIPRVGFLPADDKRVIGTVEAVQRELTTSAGLVLRYPTHAHRAQNVDGLAGHEGAFLACSFWLADALTLIGRTREAGRLLDLLIAIGGDLGLLAEEWDPHTGRHLGNYPQGFSHLALADAILLAAASPDGPARQPTFPATGRANGMPAAQLPRQPAGGAPLTVSTIAREGLQ